MAYSVLIVDDSPAMRKFIRRVLALSGLDIGECHEAEDGRKALEVLRSRWMDIVLTDINMPVMSGEGLLEELSGDPVLHSVPVVVISTDHSQERLNRMLALGAKDYVTKPFVPETLRNVFEKHLAGEDYAKSEY